MILVRVSYDPRSQLSTGVQHREVCMATRESRALGTMLRQVIGVLSGSHVITCESAHRVKYPPDKSDSWKNARERRTVKSCLAAPDVSFVACALGSFTTSRCQHFSLERVDECLRNQRNHEKVPG